ncbi:MAG: hypothetical protein GWO38_06410 [Phycisphaerae bacterium]|nr:hypothetical protein [Phycisphaerae bacterium]NIW97708.1 hypothetical protein [Phycisphaerae bacterium]NIX27266.1 hypothetical protein [Phycisphaerae bacterium]
MGKMAALAGVGRTPYRGLPYQPYHPAINKTEDNSMPNQIIAWRKVALAILPGIFALGFELELGQHLVMDSHLLAGGLVFLCLVLCIIGFARERYFAVWSFPALGIGLMYFAFLLVNWSDTIGIRWLQSSLFVIFYGIVPMLVGLFLAQRTGVLAGLVFIGVAYVFWESIGDPEYALLMYTNNTALVTFVSICPQLVFLIVVPIVVMRLFSTKTRIIGYLGPIIIAFVTTAGVSSAIRPYSSFAWIVGMDFLFIVVPLIIILGVYTLVEKKALALNLVSQT